MKKLLPLLALFAFTAAVPATSPLTAPVDYRFDDVRRTVTLAKAGDASSQQKSAATKGQRAQSGDKVHTGWFSYALISSEKHRAKFEIFSSSDVELAGNEPGVILSLERGKLHAMFDKITGTEPRVVKTPGALLAVRGTQYVAEVNARDRADARPRGRVLDVQPPPRPRQRPHPTRPPASGRPRRQRRQPPRSVARRPATAAASRRQRTPRPGRWRDGRAGTRPGTAARRPAAAASTSAAVVNRRGASGAQA